jgi:hypothetical protein
MNKIEIQHANKSIVNILQTCHHQYNQNIL